MTKAPERIWVPTWYQGGVYMAGSEAEYIRSDLYDELMRAADYMAGEAWHMWEACEDTPRSMFKALNTYEKAREKINEV